MRIRTSGAILAAPHPDGWLFYNFISKTAALCTHEAVSLLKKLNQWSEFEEAAMSGGEHTQQRIRNVLTDMLEHDLLVSEGTPQWEREAEFLEKWKWGTAAAALHFSTLNTPFMSLEGSTAEQLARLAEQPQPPCYLPNSPNALRLPQVDPSSPDVLNTMLRRRTNRTAEKRSISLLQLSDCLFSGFAVTGSVETAVGTLPLSITPSGGARNPYEAYVYVQSVEGLQPGIYHYSGVDHTLEAVNLGSIEDAEKMLGGQEWVRDMPAIIILVAHFERTMWKYQEANAYRVTLIEAGHRAQNIMLAATEHGLSACPTAALHHQTICDALGISDVLKVPIYALTLCIPAEETGTAVRPAPGKWQQ
jgi:SagB-type dehydrogenase family enzyme